MRDRNAYMRERRAADPDKRREYERAWYAANREHILAQDRDWRAKNREAVNASKRARRAANPELVRADANAWRKANPDKVRAANRRQRLRAYALTPEEFARRLTEQGGLCAICGGDRGPLHIDHCHKTGRVRGLLCGPCNVGLGMIERVPYEKWAAYLERAR